jgi:hypothetical protein
MDRKNFIEEGRIRAIVKCSIIDFLIDDIMRKDRYDKLTYWDKTAICKLINKKQYLFGRALA